MVANLEVNKQKRKEKGKRGLTIMKMTKKKYINFYSTLTGHSKSFVEKNLHEGYSINGTRYKFVSGMQTYSAWIINGRIYCQHFLQNTCQSAWYFDFDTYEIDWGLIEEDLEEYKEQVIKDA
jgi:hypothetical protein